MENKINIAELLKDCPKGMELGCTLFDDVHFDSVDEVCDKINCFIKDSYHKIGISFNKYGHYSNIFKSKCVIFPKGKTTWEGFIPPCKFKDGDVLAEDSCIFIIQKIGDNYTAAKTHCTLYNDGDFDDGSILYFDIDSTKLATEEEKEKLFNAIKDNGYKWNEETKTLEKLVKPKFKVGDVIQDIDTYKVKITEVSIEDECYEYESMDIKEIGSIGFSEQDNWELVPNKFDINTLKPFDNCKFSLDGGITWKYAQYWFIQEKYNTKDIDIELWQG